jgi:dipeptide/tripeptide permease
VGGETQESTSFLGRFTVLRGAPRELWMIFAVHLVGYVSYKIMNWTFVLWLSYDLGYSDQQAGWWVACWSALMTLFTVFVGSLTDAIGVRKALILSLWVCIVTRIIMTFVTVKWLALGLGMFPVALGEALGTPAMVAATRRFSTTAQRSISFSLFYASMNVGILISSFLFDHVRQTLGEPVGHLVIPLLNLELTTYRVLFLVSLVFQCLLFPLLYLGMREGVEATEDGIRLAPEQRKHAHEAFLTALWLTTRDAVRESVHIFAGLWRQSGFYRFLGFLGLAAFMRLIFVHMDYTYPKFGIRELGAGAPVGRLYAINAFLIIFFVPLVGALSQRITAFNMVTFGSVIGATSVFIMTLPQTWFQTLADSGCVRWLAHAGLGLELGPEQGVNPWYVMIFLYIVLLSVGESFYSPRLYEYAAAIAPKGQEGSYMSLSYLPFFLAKMSVATSSGVLLARYCPETGPRHSHTLWLIIAVTTAICPIGLITLRRWIRVREAGREE